MVELVVVLYRCSLDINVGGADFVCAVWAAAKTRGKSRSDLEPSQHMIWIVNIYNSSELAVLFRLVPLRDRYLRLSTGLHLLTGVPSQHYR